MRRILEGIRKNLEEFIEQRDDLLMLVSCTDDDAAIALKAVRDVEQANGTDVFLLFADEFTTPEAFASVTVASFREQRTLASDWLAERGREPLPSLPEKLANENLPPVERLARALVFARSLVPKNRGNRLVWGMFPQRIADRRAYLDLVSAFAPSRGLKPWMPGVRMIFRDQQDTATFMPGLARTPRVRVRALDVSQAAIQAALSEEVADEGLPQEQRMQALLSSALLDYAHGRAEAALKALWVLLGYYQETDNAAMQGLVLNTIGDVYHRAGALDQAQHWYECAVPPAARSKVPVILRTVAGNLGTVAFKKGQFGLAEQLYDSVDQLAGYGLDPEGKAQALEWRGLSQERQQAHARAIESWEAAATISRTIGLPGFLHANLSHLVRAYEAVGRSDRLTAVRAELRQVEGQRGQT